MKSKFRKGTTLIELMIVVTIMGIIATLGPQLYKQMRRFFFLSQTRVELQQNSRTALSIMIRRIRLAQSSTLRIDQNASQPYYSRISFVDINNHWVSYYQNGKTLYQNVDASTGTLLTSDLRYLAFALPRSDDMGIVSISFTVERSIYDGQTKALHMASEKVRIMN